MRRYATASYMAEVKEGRGACKPGPLSSKTKASSGRRVAEDSDRKLCRTVREQDEETTRTHTAQSFRECGEKEDMGKYEREVKNAISRIICPPEEGE